METEQLPIEKYLPFPERRITMRFTHPTIGDDFMMRAVEAAMRELLNNHPRGTDVDSFTASNGMQVTIESTRFSFDDVHTHHSEAQ